MIVPDASLNTTFESDFQALCVSGATWVEYWLQLDSKPVFETSVSASTAQIVHEKREIGGAAVAARALWRWGLAARLETTFGDDPNARFAQRTVENDFQENSEKIKIPALQFENLSEREQPYRVNLCAGQKEAIRSARLEHGFCDETLKFQWQRGDAKHRLMWRHKKFWLDGELLENAALSAAYKTFVGAPHGLQVLAAAWCRSLLEERDFDEALIWARTAVLDG